MTFIRRLLGTLRIYVVCITFLFFAFPAIWFKISFWSRAESWGLIQGTFRIMLALAGVKVKAVGAESVDLTKPYVMIGNHVNWLDHFILATLVPIAHVGFEKASNFRVPVYGPMMKRWGNVGVSRSKNPAEARRIAREAGELLRAGVGFLVFPEGTRSRTGAIDTFKKGGFHTAIDAAAWILPFTYNGSHDVLGTNRWWALPGTVTVTFHPPIEAARYGKAQVAQLAKDTREVIARAYYGPGSAYPAADGSPQQLPPPPLPVAAETPQETPAS
jgi:1-acyl-sn-glycerol-3-phosphate acyltransferase